MAIITEVRFAHEAGALSHTFEELPDVDVRVVRESSTDPHKRHYFIRAENEARGRIQTVLEADPTVSDATPMSSFEHSQVWVITFDPQTKLMAPRVTAKGGLVIDAQIASPEQHPRGWHERWLLPDEEAMHEIWQEAREEGFAFDLLTVQTGGHMEAKDLVRDALTDHQRRALETAYDYGYFAEPRETSLEDLGAELDLSASAVGGRLKRGMKALIGETLVVDRPGATLAPAVGFQPGSTGVGGTAGALDARATVGHSTQFGRTAVTGATSDAMAQSREISLDVYVEHSRLALSPTIGSLPSIEIGVVSDAGTDPEHDVYFFWVEANDFDAVETAFDADPTVASYTLVVRAEDRRTYGIEYTDEANLVTPSLSDLGVLVTDSRSHANGWLLSLHLQDNESLNELNEFLDGAEFQYEVFELHRGGSTPEETLFDLTESQIEALVCAYVQGYYDDPRELSLENLGSILGLSQTAVSGRLRRGSARMIEGVLDR